MPRSSNALRALPPEGLDALQRLGMRLRAQRLAHNLTVEQTAERLLCSPSTYRNLETGKPGVSLGLLVHALWLFDGLQALEKLCPLELGMIVGKRARRRRDAQGSISDEERDF